MIHCIKNKIRFIPNKTGNFVSTFKFPSQTDIARYYDESIITSINIEKQKLIGINAVKILEKIESTVLTTIYANKSLNLMNKYVDFQIADCKLYS